MRYLKYLGYVGLAGFLLLFVGASTPAQAQMRVGVGIGIGAGPAYVGPPPSCPYGYYGYYPYACAPAGYYAPDYFVNGVFIGAGPWFHGFRGPVFRGRPIIHDRVIVHERGFHGAVRGGRDFRDGGFHGGHR